MGDFPAGDIALLCGALRPEVALTVGDDVPDETEILIHGTPSAETLDRLGQLRVVVIPWAGVPQRTLPLLRERPHLALHNLHHNALPVAEMALALLLAAARRLPHLDAHLRRGDWSPRYAPPDSLLLSGKTALLVGYGEIGKRVGRMLRALEMRVLAVRRTPGEAEMDGVAVFGIERLDELLPQAQAVVVSTPLTEETRHLLDAERLQRLPNGAVVVNVGRGEVIEAQGLYDALVNGPVGAAGLDVWYQYPKDEAGRVMTFPAAVPLHTLPNVVLSPHLADHTTDTERLRMAALAALLNAAAGGEALPNAVDVGRGY